MTAATLPALVQRFFTERLLSQLGASPHTVASYRDTFRLLFDFASKRLGRPPSRLSLEDIDVALVGDFLDNLEQERANTAKTRNTRLTALRAFFRFVAYAGAHVRCSGKGRKTRCTPLRRVVAAALESWLAERGGGPDDPVFPSSRGGFLSADALQRLVARHVATGRAKCPSLAGRSITPHTLRHTTAMALLRRGVDLTVIALWLGHESVETTQIYIHADMRLKEQALGHSDSGGQQPARFRPPDPLLAFLQSL